MPAVSAESRAYPRGRLKSLPSAAPVSAERERGAVSCMLIGAFSLAVFYHYRTDFRLKRSIIIMSRQEILNEVG